LQAHQIQKYIIPLLLITILSIGLFHFGIVALAGLSALMVLVLMMFLINRQPDPFLFAIPVCLGLVPFFLGVHALGLKFYFENAFLFIYSPYFLIYLLFRKTGSPSIENKRFSATAPDFLTRYTIAVVAVFLTFHTTSFFFNDFETVSLRNLGETYILGVILFAIFYTHTNSKNIDFLIQGIMATAVIISVLGIIEYLLMENVVVQLADRAAFDEGFFIFTKEIIEITRGVYRPFISFFTPSDAGTFIALCLPFFYYCFSTSENKPFWWAVTLIPSIFIAMNYTRGVWAAIAVTAVIFVPFIRRLSLFLLPYGIMAAIASAVIFWKTPFFNRLFDPYNLIARTFYWDVGWRMVRENPFFGVGHLNFKEFYLDYVTTVSMAFDFDIKQVFVADNMLITTLVEHGLLGLISFLLLLFFFFVSLRRMAREFRSRSDHNYFHLAQAALMSLSIYVFAGLFADVHQFTKSTKLFFVIMGIGFALGRFLSRNGTSGQEASHTVMKNPRFTAAER